MSNASWGTKRTCPKCTARFYDLNKHPAECPKCGHSFDPAAMLKPRRGRTRKFSNITSEAENDENLINSIIAKAGVSTKAAGKKSLDEDDLDGLDDLKDDDLVEDVEEIEDFESLEELEAMEEGDEDGDDANEETIMEDFALQGEELVDAVEEDEEEEDEEEDPKPKRRR